MAYFGLLSAAGLVVYCLHIMGALSRQALLVSVRLMLRPLVRFCFRRALKVQEFSEIARQVFFEIAREEMSARGMGSSASRLSIATGLTRREVSRLSKDTASAEPTMNLLTRIIGKWQTHPDYANKKGVPRTLTAEGKDSEFAALVQSVSRDLNPYTILFELERTGAIEKRAGRVSLNSEVFVPVADVEEGFRILSRDTSDLIAAVEANVIDGETPPHLHIRTHYDNVAVRHVPKIRAWMLEEGTKFHARARQFLSQFDKDLNPQLAAERGGARVALSAFCFSELPESARTRAKERKKT